MSCFPCDVVFVDHDGLLVPGNEPDRPYIHIYICLLGFPAKPGKPLL